jgi:hypothetical protein
MIAPAAMADYITDFESFIFGAPIGEPITGQDGWYIPPGTDSVDGLCHTYLLNQYNIAENPTGGTVFVSGEGPGNGVDFARAQHDETFTMETWEFSYDFCCLFVGAGPAANNLGSFSAQPAPNDFIHLFAWVPGFEGELYTAGYMFHDAGGTQFAQPGNIPGPQWDNLVLNVWYRSTMLVDFASNMCTEVRISEVGGTATVFNPTDWYLEGGSAGSTAPMEAFRLFAGAISAPGNVVALDNLVVRVAASTPVENATWGGIKARFK